MDLRVAAVGLDPLKSEATRVRRSDGAHRGLEKLNDNTSSDFLSIRILPNHQELSERTGVYPQPLFVQITQIEKRLSSR